MFLKYSKATSFVLLEMFHNTAFHFIETVKVRGQARNLHSGDISGYFANKVQSKRKCSVFVFSHILPCFIALISGVVSGFLGAGMGGLTFMTMHNLLSNQVYGCKPDSVFFNMDFRVKNMGIFMMADLVASITKLPFETRKQLVQMSNYEISLKHISRNAYLGLAPLIARDTSFRFIILSTYYLTTDIEHRPVLKYTIP